MATRIEVVSSSPEGSRTIVSPDMDTDDLLEALSGDFIALGDDEKTTILPTSSILRIETQTVLG